MELLQVPSIKCSTPTITTHGRRDTTVTTFCNYVKPIVRISHRCRYSSPRHRHGSPCAVPDEVVHFVDRPAVVRETRGKRPCKRALISTSNVPQQHHPYSVYFYTLLHCTRSAFFRLAPPRGLLLLSDNITSRHPQPWPTHTKSSKN